MLYGVCEHLNLFRNQCCDTYEDIETMDVRRIFGVCCIADVQFQHPTDVQNMSSMYEDLVWIF